MNSKIIQVASVLDFNVEFSIFNGCGYIFRPEYLMCESFFSQVFLNFENILWTDSWIFFFLAASLFSERCVHTRIHFILNLCRETVGFSLCKYFSRRKNSPSLYYCFLMSVKILAIEVLSSMRSILICFCSFEKRMTLGAGALPTPRPNSRLKCIRS